MAKKNLIMVNGTMGVGKSTVCKALLPKLQPAVFVDGDWCWTMEPFTVNDETKRLVQKNIVCLLSNDLSCSVYQNVLFCWVMQEKAVIRWILDSLIDLNIDFQPFLFTLMAREETLRERLKKDIAAGVRSVGIVERSISRLPLYDGMDGYTNCIQTDGVSPLECADQIASILEIGK